MDVRIDATGGNDAAFACDHFGPRTDHDVDPRLDVWVARLADAADAAVANADIGLDDAPMVEDHGIGDDGVDGTLRTTRLPLPLPHAVADDFAAAKFDLLAINRPIALDLDEELGIGQAQPVAGRRPVHCGISVARYCRRHRPIRACR